MRDVMWYGLIAVGGWLLFHSDGQTAEEPSPMNVIWIIADDLSPDLGCYGYGAVKTPHIDRLSDQGARFQSAFATAPVCSSSRSAFITGVYQTTIGAHHHRTIFKKPLARPYETIVQLMRDAGYYVCNADSSLKRPGKTDYNFEMSGKIYDSPDWSNRKPGQPFFAQIQIHEPHRRFVKATPEVANRKYSIPPYYPDHEIIRADWANYIQSVEVLDQKVGDVLERLERDGLEEETVVFFFGDHGRPHYRDKQWLYDGGIRVPLLVRHPGRTKPGDVREELVSLIDVAAATIAIAGVDAPDWMDGENFLADGFDGRDAVFAARDRCGSTLDRIRCVRTNRYKYIRNFEPARPYRQHSGYKEMQYPGMTVARVLHQQGKLTGAAANFWTDRRPREELYDLLADPHELTNLASKPEHAETLANLRSTLDAWMSETDDQGRFVEATAEKMKIITERSDKWYRDRMEKRGLGPHPDPKEYLQWWRNELGLK